MMGATHSRFPCRRTGMKCPGLRAPAITVSLSCVRIVGTSGDDVGYVGTKQLFAPALRGWPLTRFLCEWSSYYSRVKGSFCPNPNRAPRMDAAEREIGRASCRERLW